MKSLNIEQFLEQDNQKELLRLLTAGSVDDGKSTLIGRLLFDSKRLYEDQLQALERDSRRAGNAGKSIDYALLCDGLKAEREQGITIDVAYRYFATSRRKFIIADTPGHEQYTRNMVTGGSTAEVAIILVDARTGVVTQTRRHSYIVSLLGIRHIVLAVNKMDLVGYSEARFQQIVEQYRAWLQQQSITSIELHPVPISALYGDNIVNRSESMPWYYGSTLLELLESVEIADNSRSCPFRFPVQYVIRPNLDFRGFAGKVASGSIAVGEQVIALPSARHTRIKQIVTYDGNKAQAYTSESVTLTLEDETDISRGEMIVAAKDTLPKVAHNIKAVVVWMDEQPLDRSKKFYIKHNTHTTRAHFESIDFCIDINNYHHIAATTLQLNQIAQVDIVCTTPLICDMYSENRATGAFIVIDPLTNFTAAAGMIVEAHKESKPSVTTTTVSLKQCGITAQYSDIISRLCLEIERQAGITIKITE